MSQLQKKKKQRNKKVKIRETLMFVMLNKLTILLSSLQNNNHYDEHKTFDSIKGMTVSVVITYRELTA